LLPGYGVAATVIRRLYPFPKSSRWALRKGNNLTDTVIAPHEDEMVSVTGSLVSVACAVR
jgi:hypothetical protein